MWTLLLPDPYYYVSRKSGKMYLRLIGGSRRSGGISKLYMQLNCWKQDRRPSQDSPVSKSKREYTPGYELI